LTVMRFTIFIERNIRYQDLPLHEPPILAPPKLTMTFFPAALHWSTRPWLFEFMQMGTVGAILHCVSQTFLSGDHT
jgi:hypothetical protein